MSNSNDYLNNDSEEELRQEEANNLDNDEYLDDGMQDSSSDNVKSKNPIRNFINDPFGSISNGFKSIFKKKRKPKLKEIWKRIPLKFKIAIIGGGSAIVLIVVIILSIGDVASKIAVEDRATGVSKLNITEESTEASKVALELYNKYDSLIGFTTEQLNVIFETFKENDTTRNKYLLSSGTKKMGNNGGDKFSPDEERTLYEHIQRTEKYNFNKIKWKSYTHTEDNVDMELEERSDLELFVPKGIDEATLNTLLKTTAPYLLTQDIPLGILSGMVGYSGGTSSTNATTAENFTYQIIKEALTKMTVNKYELETLKLQSSYDDCNYNTYVVDYTIRTYDNGYEEIVWKGQPRLDSTRNEKTNETKIDGTEQYTYETFWYVAEALTYDRVINNSFNHQKYSSDDVSNLTNPDSNNLINTIEINELYETIEPMITIDNGDTKKPSNGKYTDNSHTYKYTQKEGTTYVYEKEWKDKLTVNQASNEVYNYNTAKEFNTKNNDNYPNIKTSKTIIEEAKFTQDNPEGNSLFDDLMDEDKRANLYGMSIIDLMNSNSGIYNQYIRRNSASSEYQAISRANLRPAYNQVKNIINVLVNKVNSEDSEDSGEYTINSYTTGHAIDGAVPFVYGSSLGYEVTQISTYSNTSSNYISGMDLLKEYIRAFEGSGKQPVQTNSEGIECYVAYRDSGGDLTVGYGVNLDGNPGNKKDLENQIGQTIDVGTLVPVEMVDAIEEEKIKGYYDTVKAKTNGLDLKEYQLHALTSLEYNNIKVDKIVNYYNDPNYWNEETDDKYETVYEKYKDNETAVGQIEAEADMTRGLYTNWLALNVHDQKGNRLPGLERRRRSEYILFSLGYYNTLQTFYTSGGVAPSGDVLVSNGQFDEAACLNLQIWFETNIFSGKLPGASSDLTAWKKVSAGSSTNFNSADYGKYATGSSYAQCPWWSRIRANMFLEANGHELISGSTGHGLAAAKNAAEYLGINYYSGDQMDQLRANAIISYDKTGGNEFGHVAYVEAVTDTHYIISHCGSGKYWHGLLIVSKEKNHGIGGVGPVVGFCNLDEAI